MGGLAAKARDGGVVFDVRVAPRSSRDAVLGVHAGALKVSLTAPPVGGAANASLCKLLARQLGVSKGAVRILKGESSRQKVVQVDGLGPEALPW